MTAPTAPAPTAPAPTSGRRWKAAIVVGILAIGFLLPLRGLLRSQGPPMEEGFMLVFPERVLHGALPNRDFLHLYGPGSLWALAAWFKVFGVTLEAQRLFALLQQIGVVAGVYALARAWGRTVALACAALALIIIVPPIGLTALAWVGAVALATLGLAAVLHGRRRAPRHERDALRWALVGGMVLGAALLFRLDLVVAVGLGATAATWGLGRRFAGRVVLGAAIGVSPYLVHLATAGPATVVRGMVLDPVVYLRGGRRLPIPPPWGHLDGFLQRAGATDQMRWPSIVGSSQQLFLWFCILLATVLFLVVAGTIAVRRDRERFPARVLLATALLGLGMLPQAMQRVDSAHFAWVSCVPLAFLPAGLVEITRGWFGRVSMRARGLVAGTLVFALLVVVLPHFTVRSYTDYVLQTFGHRRIAWEIRNGDRHFYYGRQDVADAANAMLPEVDRITRRGDRVFVGTTDLRQTPYSDAYLYYLLPRLVPATYFIEMDPGVANRKGSRLASDLASADVAILSSVWKDWDEPNDSRKVGDAEPNRVLARDFCLVRSYGNGLYDLYRRRPTGGPCPPGTTVPAPPGI